MPGLIILKTYFNSIYWKLDISFLLCPLNAKFKDASYKICPPVAGGRGGRGRGGIWKGILDKIIIGPCTMGHNIVLYNIIAPDNVTS